jgi:hypothetical protein
VIRKAISITLLQFITLIGFAQSIAIKKASFPVTIDAVMDEAAWTEAAVANHFKQYFPFDSSYAKAPTEVRITYDAQNLYIFAVMHNLGPRKYVTPSLRRDFRGEANDGFTVLLDTYQDKTNAFQFGVNPFGVQREGLISNGGSRSDDLSLNWDNKWYSVAKIMEDRWVCEMAIPFKTLRFKNGLDSWNINFYRIDSEYNERTTWAAIPRIYPIISLAFLNTLLWDEPLKNPGGNTSIIPYAATGFNRDFRTNTAAEKQLNFGGDVKIALGPALNLDLTINPDFSQVEVDQQVTNLDRFEIFYPEKRQFFLENADLFASFGYSNARPFFSRRMGVTRDPSTGQNIQNTLYGGARLSGKINNNWRIGFLSMQAAEDNSIDLPTYNYSVAAVQRKIFTRSNLGACIVNKESFAQVKSDSLGAPTQYNRVIGIDYNLASKNNKWTGKFFYHRSFDQQKTDSTYATTASLNFAIPNWEFSLLAQDIGANYNAETGFVRRKNYRRIAPEGYWNIYPKSKIVNKHGPGFDVDYLWNDLYGALDWDANLWYRVSFQNTSDFFIRFRRDYVYLFSSFDPSGSGGVELPAGSAYLFNSILFSYQSNARKPFFYDLQSRFGEYFNGHRQNIEGSIAYRFQPHLILSLDFSYNRIRLPAPYRSSDLILLGPKFDITFSRTVFWTTFFQYNNQIHNININSRIQWRFKPVSDIFLVYTDNYASNTYTDEDGINYIKGQPKLRALVLKITYWLNR